MKKKVFIVILIGIVIVFGLYKFTNTNDDVSKSVVAIEAYKNGKLLSEGTGFVYKIEDYCYILTNYHVLNYYDKIIVYNTYNKIEADVLAFDEYEDIAILIVDKDFVDKALNIGKISNNNDKIYIKGVGENKYNRKTISGILLSDKEPFKFNYDNKIKMLDVIKFKANIVDGDSGSPILDKNNKVIGIVTMRSNDNTDEAYALPIDDVMKEVNLLEKIDFKRVNLGIEASTYGDNISGVLLDKVYENYIAYKAGLRENDIIVSIDGVDIKDVSEFRYYLYKHKINDEIRLKYYRDGSYNDVVINGK